MGMGDQENEMSLLAAEDGKRPQKGSVIKKKEGTHLNVTRRVAVVILFLHIYNSSLKQNKKKNIKCSLSYIFLYK